MNRFRQTYDSLPDEAKDAIMEHLLKAMMWRGWAASSNGLMGLSMLHHVEEMARVFGDCGHEIEEYT